MTYDQWKTTEPEPDPIWIERGYRNIQELFEAVSLGVESLEVEVYE